MDRPTLDGGLPQQNLIFRETRGNEQELRRSQGQITPVAPIIQQNKLLLDPGWVTKTTLGKGYEGRTTKTVAVSTKEVTGERNDGRSRKTYDVK